MREIYQTIWAENKYLILAQNKAIYEEMAELVKEERYEELYPLLKENIKVDDEFDNYKEAAQEIWGHFKNKERDNSHFFASLNNQNENLRLLWGLCLTYTPVYLLNCRIFMNETHWNKAWVIKNNKMRLFYWDGVKYFRLRLPAELMLKVCRRTELEKYSTDEVTLLEKGLIVVRVDNKLVLSPKIAYALDSGLEIE